MVIRQIFVSAGHNYFGHHGRAPDDFPLVEVDRIECVAGHGIRGDRFYDYRDDYKGQITFFASEVFERLAAHFGLRDKSAGALRRNVVVSGVNLNDLIGEEFSIQGVRLRGTGHCKPCYWMNYAVAPGTEEFLQGNGGLRAQILSDGVIAVGEAQLLLAEPRLIES
jgi:MOSC domain-containing protein YiiM